LAIFVSFSIKPIASLSVPFKFGSGDFHGPYKNQMQFPTIGNWLSLIAFSN
jgi:hypothetical protein